MSLSERRKKFLIFLTLCLVVVGVFIFIIGKNNKTEAADGKCPLCKTSIYGCRLPTCTEDGYCNTYSTSTSKLNHNWKDPTCTDNEYCSVCGYVNPNSALGHNYVVDEYSSDNHVLICTRCSRKNTEAHNLQEADCTRNTHCDICGYEIPNTAKGHSFSILVDVNYTHHVRKCMWCDATKRETHTYIPATCLKPATCEICEVAHNGSALGPHNWGADGKCTVCGETKTSGGNQGGGGGRKSNNL